ncbi:MAG: hypothetical protein V4735_02240 [Pseudomonadota bacterium]
MVPENQLTAFVVNLNKLTSLDTVRWRAERPPASLTGTDDIITLFLSASYGGYHLALYQRQKKTFVNPDGGSFIRTMTITGFSEKLEPRWHKETILGVLESGSVVWETTSPHSAISDLMETARAKAAKVDSLFKMLIPSSTESGS